MPFNRVMWHHSPDNCSSRQSFILWFYNLLCSTFMKHWNPTFSTNDSGRLASAIISASTHVICNALGLVFLNFSVLWRVCHKVAWRSFLVSSKTASTSLCPSSCFTWRCFRNLLILKELLFVPPLASFALQSLNSAKFSSSLSTSKYFQAAKVLLRGAAGFIIV